jgi:hypothetical protein
MQPLSAVVADVLAQLKLGGVRPEDCRLSLRGKALDLATPVRFAALGRNDKLELHTGKRQTKPSEACVWESVDDNCKFTRGRYLAMQATSHCWGCKRGLSSLPSACKKQHSRWQKTHSRHSRCRHSNRRSHHQNPRRPNQTVPRAHHHCQP